MLYFNIREVFHACGITNVYRTLIGASFSQRVAYNLAHDHVVTIRLEHLEKICRIFNCTPNDLISFRPNKNDVLPANHALTKLQHKTIPNIRKLLNALSYEELTELAKQIKTGETGERKE